jgi:hypothetical protein
MKIKTKMTRKCLSNANKQWLSNQQAIQQIQNNPKLHSNERLLINQALRFIIRGYILVDKNREEKTYKMIMKGF